MWECELWVCNLNICTTQQYSFSQSSLVRTLLSYFCCLCASRINCTDVWWTAHRFMSTQLLATDHAEPILNVIMIFIFLASYLSLLKIRADTWSARSVFSITVFFFECYCFIQWSTKIFSSLLYGLAIRVMQPPHASFFRSLNWIWRKISVFSHCYFRMIIISIAILME